MIGRTKKLYAAVLVALLALALGATAAFAAVTYDPDTGTGFVGKGDVQTAFGWNNSQLQANASTVTFSYNATDTYDAVCTFTTGEGTRGERTHNIDHTKSTVVNSTVASQLRKNNQLDITGFNLTGKGATTTQGTVPVVGEACPGNLGTDGTWTSVTPTGSTGGLFVNYGGVSVPL
jgi:hypothetical protein